MNHLQMADDLTTTMLAARTTPHSSPIPSGLLMPFARIKLSVRALHSTILRLGQAPLIIGLERATPDTEAALKFGNASQAQSVTFVPAQIPYYLVTSGPSRPSGCAERATLRPRANPVGTSVRRPDAPL